MPSSARVEIGLKVMANAEVEVETEGSLRHMENPTIVGTGKMETLNVTFVEKKAT